MIRLLYQFPNLWQKSMRNRPRDGGAPESCELQVFGEPRALLVDAGSSRLTLQAIAHVVLLDYDQLALA